MITFFMFCAVVGGTILACQVALTVLGLGHDSTWDSPHDVPDAGGIDADGHDSGDSHASSAFFGMLTFRTVTAATAFFGISGLAAHAAEYSTLQSLLIALTSGAAAMVTVYHLMRFLTQLQADGTVDLSDAVEEEGVVYVRIPPERRGRGKIHIVLKGQTTELAAETWEDEIPSGTGVRVREMIGTDVVLVERLVRPSVVGLGI